jgi:hypothetical protein
MGDEVPQLVMMGQSAVAVNNRANVIHVALFDNDRLAYHITCDYDDAGWTHLGMAPFGTASLVKHILVTAVPVYYYATLIVTLVFNNGLTISTTRTICTGSKSAPHTGTWKELPAINWNDCLSSQQ